MVRNVRGLLPVRSVGCAAAVADNAPQRVDWFTDQAVGMFVHWSVDSQIGSVISHSLVGASQAYLDRFVREGDIWFTRAQDSDTVYAFLTRLPDWDTWQCGRRREFTIKSLRATEQTQISVLGRAGRVLEYQDNADPRPRWSRSAVALHVSIMRAQRIYNDWKWPNPLVLKITHVEPVR